MIEEKINKSLNQLETQLKDVKSAREQVEKTVSSFDGLSQTASDYVNSLKGIENKLSELISLVGEDYKEKTSGFDKDRNAIIKSCNEAIDRVKDTAETIKTDFADTVKSFQNRLNYILIANIVIFIMIIVILFVVLK